MTNPVATQHKSVPVPGTRSEVGAVLRAQPPGPKQTGADTPA
jgi:hypothetical protein